jgi:hypothetical protein
MSHPDAQVPNWAGEEAPTVEKEAIMLITDDIMLSLSGSITRSKTKLRIADRLIEPTKASLSILGPA